MSTCNRCEKSGFFLSLHRGLCLECAEQVQSELMQAHQFIQNNYDTFEVLSEASNVSLDEALEITIPLIESFNCISDFSLKGWASGFDNLNDVRPLLLAEADLFIITVYGEQKEKLGLSHSALQLTQKAKEFFVTYSKNEELIHSLEEQERMLIDSLAELQIAKAEILDARDELLAIRIEYVSNKVTVSDDPLENKKSLAELLASETEILNDDLNLKRRMIDLIEGSPEHLCASDMEEIIAELGRMYALDDERKLNLYGINSIG